MKLNQEKYQGEQYDQSMANLDRECAQKGRPRWMVYE